MQWPKSDTKYINLLQKIIVENSVTMIVALGSPRNSARKNLLSSRMYWSDLGTTCKNKNKSEPRSENYDMYEVSGILGKHSCDIFHLKNWPDMDIPSHKEMSVFEFVFKKIEAIENVNQRVIIHCWAGVGRSGTFRLLYRAWKRKFNSSHLVEEFIKQRSLRKETIQTRTQYNFLQRYVHILEKSTNN